MVNNNILEFKRKEGDSEEHTCSQIAKIISDALKQISESDFRDIALVLKTKDGVIHPLSLFSDKVNAVGLFEVAKTMTLSGRFGAILEDEQIRG